MVYNFGLLDFSTPQLVIILAIVLLLFGGKKLPELSKSLGSSMRELRKGLSEDEKNEKRTEEKTRQQSAS